MSPQPPIQITAQSSPFTSNKSNIGKISSSVSMYQNVQNYVKELEISEGQLSSCIK